MVVSVAAEPHASAAEGGLHMGSESEGQRCTRWLQDSAGGGLVFWQPKGAMVRNQLETFWKDIHLARGYDLLYTPHIAKVDLWKTSGHFEHYGENMFDQMTVRLLV